MKHSLLVALTIMLSACYSDGDISEAISSAEEDILDQIKQIVYDCEQDLYNDGMLMDEGCLEDEFNYDGDFYNCEVTPSFMVVDGDCILYKL